MCTIARVHGFRRILLYCLVGPLFVQEMLEFHKAKGAEATILVTKVEDPSAFGVVVTDGDMCVERFVEKPKVR